MEKIEIIRQRYQEARNAYNTALHAPAAYYYEGKMVGIVEGVAAGMGISWLEADILINKSEEN
jgi:hypothetical protein